MVDFAALSAHHTSPEANAMVKKRARSEARLKAYGITAIVLSALALVSLLWTVIGNASSALTEHYITLEVPLDAETVDPDGSNDPKKVLRADYAGLSKFVLREKFPSASSRSDKKALYELISGGAAFELGEMVSNDLDLIGTTISYPFLASDTADLYFKGAYGQFEPVNSAGDLTVTIDGKDAVIETDPSSFADLKRAISKELNRRALRREGEAGQEANGASVFAERAAAATDADEKAKLQKQVEARSAKRDALIAQAEALRAMANADAYIGKLDKDMPSLILTSGTAAVKVTELTETGALGKVITPLAEGVAPAWEMRVNTMPERARKMQDNQIVWMDQLVAEDRVEKIFNWRFFSSGTSREPELAGIWVALIGSFLTMLVTFVLAFPIGVLSAIYLEEFAPKNKITNFIEVNINNLAAVPSIIFGLLGLAVFLGFFGVPRSAPIAGGIVLALMSLPTIIIASRASIRAVPQSIRDAALGLGASKLQSSFHHVLPLAMPGILTGSIIAMAQALGETAPLIMIGMVAFIVDPPSGFTDSATVLPVQVYQWADLPERAFEARTAAAILVLLAFLVVMNGLAVLLRKRFERRW